MGLVFTGFTRGLNATDQDLLLIRKDSASCIAESIVSLPSLETQNTKPFQKPPPDTVFSISEH